MTIKSSKTLIIITILLLPTFFSIPLTQARITKNAADGIWYEDFIYEAGENLSITLTDCDLYPQDGYVELNRSDDTRIYEYKEGTDNQIYWSYFGLIPVLGDLYLTLRELPLPNFLPDKKTGSEFFFNSNDIKGLYRPNDGKAATRSASNRRVIYHHFRIHMNIAATFIDFINITWRGTADSEENVKLYFYKYTSNKRTFGQWSRLNNDSDVTNEYMYGIITQADISRALNKNNYLDIYVACIAGNGNAELSTDYFKIRAELTDAYLTENGSVETLDFIAPLELSNIKSFYWEQLIWDDLTKPNTDIVCQLLYENTTGNLIPIEDEFLPGNKNGFSGSPVNLNNLNTQKYNKVKIRVNLSSTDPNITPRLYQLALTWQNDITKWQDLFNTDFRIDVRNRLNLNTINGEGFLNIKDIIGDWPFVGFDIQNTHATDTRGPKNDDLWWQEYLDGKVFKHEVMTPVIRDGELYVTSYLSKKLFRIRDISRQSSSITEIDFGNDKFIQTSPILTEDSIIVAAGKDNQSKSTIYAVDRTTFNVTWEFTYDDDILYPASPIFEDNVIYITSGDPVTKPSVTNKVFALDIKRDTQWNYTLPMYSESTPSIWNDFLIVCCHENALGAGKTIYAFDKNNGDQQWNKSIGDIGKASVVVYNNTLYVTSKDSGKIKITALNPQNGSVKWNTVLGSRTNYKADSTPAVHLGTLYVVHPDGILYAVSTNTGIIRWQNQIFSGIYGITTSPCYADNILYIGLPSPTLNGQGRLIAFNIATKTTAWSYPCDMYGQKNSVYSSPVVTNGLVFFGDEWNNLYIVGKYNRTQENIKGFLISNPIELPRGSWFNKFYAATNTTTGLNSITFSLLNENKSKLTDLTKGQTITLGEGITNRVVRLRADFTAKNVTVNTQLFSWNISFIKDDIVPVFDLKSFRPGIWTNEIVSRFTINVTDKGTGLLVSSAKFKLSYKIGVNTYDIILPAKCTGKNGTTAKQTITAIISNESFYPNITALNFIEFTIYDLANNVNITNIPFKQDIRPPTSILDNKTFEKSYTTPMIKIDAKASDPGTANQNASGIAKVELNYRYSSAINPTFSGSWKLFAADTQTPYQFEFTPKEHGGWYELQTVATDVIGNKEVKPDTGEVTFLFDNEPPAIPDPNGENWFSSTPSFTITFRDDYLLNSVEYKPNFDTTWTLIDSDIQQKTYSDPWNLKSSFWDQMNPGEQYYIHFRITDTLGNTRLITEEENALLLKKDTVKPIVSLEAPQLVGRISWENIFLLSGYADDSVGSGIKTVTLQYSYSDDNTTWGTPKPYGDDITTSDIEWEFTAEDGNGYYKFSITAVDYAGNQDALELIIEVKSFPTVLVGALFVLLAIFIVLTLFFIWWKKTHPA
ncbi:MAG: PQQ-like beta-propeller repeat protein [Candidatus Thermoplasmatota archaeon]|nr:PQQ-like beta-propeller repeat protein [Candidatus Thermoplasmatota archaeon]MBU1941268.1 PQQ-like beta-propeller repeat protein [Candidatus Thermoplasmatota archaeon]